MSARARGLVSAAAVLLIVLALPVGTELGVRAADGDDPLAHRAVATVLAPGPPVYPDENALVPDDGLVRARWIDGRGREHVEELYLPGRPEVGETRRIWIDRHGEPTATPLDGSTVALVVTAVLVLAGVAALVTVRLASRSSSAQYRSVR